MVAKKSTDWLPAGWKVEHKVQNNGRKAEYYTNSATGQKFYSKNDVVRYLNMGSIHCNPPQSIDTQLSNFPQSVDSQLSNLPQSVDSQLSKHSREGHNQVVVKANEFPEWLPEGWIMELKTHKSGSNIGKEYKCYVDPSTGRKCYSKPEVFQYLKSAKRDSYSSKQQELGIDARSKEDNVVEPNEFPEWLPKGWSVELKTRKIGPRLGSEYKCYVDPSTGHKFYSKPEVFRYLKSVKYDSCSSEQKDLSVGQHFTENCYIDPSMGHTFYSKPEVFKSVKHDCGSSEQKDLSLGRHSAEDVVVGANESPDWLPKGWIVELKTHKSGSKIGKKYKYYVDPSTGRKFLSKPEVFRYLESVRRDSCSSKQKDLDAGEHSTGNFQTDHSPEAGTSKQNVTENVKDMKHNLSSCKPKKTNVGMPARNVSVEKVAPDGLPPGWVLEIKTKGKRRDPYYTDPVSGYVFRSRKDVFRYLETGEISRHALKPKKRNINDSEMTTDEIFPPSAATTQGLSNRATRRQLFAGNENSEVGSLALTNAEGANISRVTRSFSKTRLLVSPTTESTQDKHPLKHITAGKGSSEVSILALPNAEGTSIRRVTRAFAKTGLLAAPATEDVQEKLPLKHTTANKGTSEVSNLALPTTEGASVRRVTRAYAKNLLGSAPTTEGLQEKHPVEHIPSGKEGSAMSSLALPNAEGTIIRRVAGGSTITQLVLALTSENLEKKNLVENAINKCVKTSEISDPSGSAFPEAKDLKRKRGKTVHSRTKHVSTPAADILQEEKLMDYTTETCAEAKEKTYPAKGSNRKQGKKGSADNGSVPVPTADMLDEGKLLKNGVEKHINRRTQKNSNNIKNRKEINLTRRSSKRLAGLGSELVGNLNASEKAPEVAATRDNSEDILALNLVVDTVAQWASQPLVANPEFRLEVSVGPGNPLNEEPTNNSNMLPEGQTEPKHVGNSEAEKKDEEIPEFAHKASVGPGNSLAEEPSNTSNMLPEDQTDLKKHAGNLETEKKDEGNPEPQPSFAFGDSWTDPCLEFAFKTLTGALPIEDNRDIQDYFQHQSGITHTQRDHSMGVPELGLTNTFEIDDLFRCDAPVIPMSGQQQIPVNPPFMPSSNVSLPSRNGIGPQQPHGGEQ